MSLTRVNSAREFHFVLRDRWLAIVAVGAVWVLLSGCAGRQAGFQSTTYEIVEEQDPSARAKLAQQFNNRKVGSVFGGADGGVQLELSDYDSELALELGAVPLEFELGYPEAAYAFERGRMFFQRFGGGEALTMRGSRETSLSGKRSGISGVSYSLVRREQPNGNARFFAVCKQPSGGALEGVEALRCRNFARFVRDGKIEDRLVRD